MKRLAALPLCLGLASLAAAQETTLKEVTVNATADENAERKQAATQKIIINRQDIENMGALTVSDVMGKLPGVDAGTAGSDGSMSLRSRGMTRDSVQIYIDGERMSGHAGTAQATVGRLPSTELERVEILRGASAEFGGNAPVTINLVLKKARSKDSTALKAAVGYRNNRPNAQFTLTKGGGDKAFSWVVPVTLNYHNMPSTSEVVRRDSAGTWQANQDDGYFAMKETVFSPRFTWKADRDSFTLSPTLFRAFGRRANDATRTDYAAPTDSNDRHDAERSRTELNRVRGEGEMIRNGIKYSTRIAGSDSDRRSTVDRTTTDALGSASAATEQSRRQEHDINGSLRLDWGADKHALSAALEHFGHHSSDSQSSISTSHDSEESHHGWDKQWLLWIQDEWGVTKEVTVTGGVRSEFIRYEMDGNHRRYDRALPSIAVRWEPAQQWVFRSSLGAAIKPPKMNELSSQPVYSIGTNSPTEADKRGNPDLRAERSINYEAVLERYLPDEMGVFGANIYARQTQDFIERRVTLEGSRWVDRPWNEGKALHWGLELDGKLRTDALGWHGATVRTHLTLPRSRVHDERLGITRAARETPRYLISAGLDQTLSGGMSFGTSVQHSGAVRTQVPGEQDYVTKQRTVLDAYALKKLTGQLNLRLSLQNLLKAKTESQSDFTSSTDWWSLENTGTGTRNILLSLEGKW
jgi:outer membrane receptor for ferrienterochelin and colicins